MTPYDRAWDMGSYTEYMTVYDCICQVVRIPDVVARQPEPESLVRGTVAIRVQRILDGHRDDIGYLPDIMIRTPDIGNFKFPISGTT